MNQSKKASKQSQKDLKPKKALSTKEAASVKGGRKAGKGQQDFLVVTMKDNMISG